MSSTYSIATGTVRGTAFLAAAIFIATLPVRLVADDQATTAALLRRIFDLNRLTRPPSAAERAISAAGHGAGEHRFAGPAVLTRIAATSRAGRITISGDGATVFDGELNALFDGQKFPFGPPLGCLAGPGGAVYAPIAFARECVVTIRDCPGAYSIDGVSLSAAPQPLSAQPDEAVKAALTEVEAALRSGLTDKQLLGESRRLPIAVEGQFTPNKKERLIRETIDGAGTIRALYVALTDRSNPRTLYALHGCILRVYWDGAEQPAVEAPLCDFFGSGFDLSSVGGLTVGTDKLLELPLPDRRAGQETFLYCHFPMPFAKGAVVEVENLAGTKFGLMLYIEVDRAPPDAAALRFHARYRRTDSWTEPLSIAKLSGRGRVVGCLLNVDCPTTAPWSTARLTWCADSAAEAQPLGDDVASFFGVGAPLEPVAHALYGVTRTGPYGKSSLYRWLLTDSLPFQKSAQLTIQQPTETLPPGTYVGALLYWYAAAGATHDFKSLDPKTWAAPGLRIPGAVEIEGRVRGEKWGTESKQKHAGPVEFSGELAARIAIAEPVQIVLPAAAAGRAKLKLRLHPRRHFETIEITGPDGAPIGTVKFNPQSNGIYEVGEITLLAGENLLTVKCSKPAVLDCWIVEPLP